MVNSWAIGSRRSRESAHAPAGRSRAARLLLVLGGVFVVAAGGVLWSRHGPAVFSDYVLSALAFCF